MAAAAVAKLVVSPAARPAVAAKLVVRPVGKRVAVARRVVVHPAALRAGFPLRDRRAAVARRAEPPVVEVAAVVA